MRKKSRSRSKSASTFRKHKRTNPLIKENNIVSSDSEDSDRSKSIITNRKQYTLEEKKNYINAYKKLKSQNPKRGIYSIASELNLSYSSLREWIKQESLITEVKCRQNKFRLKGAGRLPDTEDIEEDLVKWIQEQRRLEIGITTNEIINKSCELLPIQKEKSYHALQIWCLRFLNRHSYSIRSISHIGQKLKENSYQEYKNFYNILYALRTKLGDAIDYGNLYNMDETPIYFESVMKKTIAPIGERSVSIKTHGGEHIRITLMLTICANGTKLPPLIVFKGTKDAKKEEKLKRYIKSKNKRVLAFCQENSWADKEIFYKWLENIFFNNKYVNTMNPKILIIDRATTHYDETLSETFKKYNGAYVLIPPGLTRFIQPLDVSINGPLKKKFHHWYLDYIIEHKNEKKPSCEDIIDAVDMLWYDETIITKEQIIKSFKITAISSNLNGSENSLIMKHPEISDDIIVPEDFALNDIKIEDILSNNTNKTNKIGKDAKITDFFKSTSEMDLDE